MLSAGDAVFHPRHGFGAVSGLTRRNPRYPIQEAASDSDSPAIFQ